MLGVGLLDQQLLDGGMKFLANRDLGRGRRL
jgi:hypothetical protein